MELGNWFTIQGIDYVVLGISDGEVSEKESLAKYLADTVVPNNEETWTTQVEKLMSEYKNNHEQIEVFSTFTENQAKMIMELVELNNTNTDYSHGYFKTLLDYAEVSTRISTMTTKESAEVVLAYMIQFMNENFYKGDSIGVE